MRRSLKIAAGAALATLVGMTGAQALQVIPGVAGYRDSWPQAFGQPSLVTGTNWSADWMTKNFYSLPGAAATPTTTACDPTVSPATLASGAPCTSGPGARGGNDVGNLHWPWRPYLDKDAVTAGDNVINVHGTCGLYDPRTRRGELTPYPIDIPQSGIGPKSNRHVHNYPKAEPGHHQEFHRFFIQSLAQGFQKKQQKDRQPRR